MKVTAVGELLTKTIKRCQLGGGSHINPIHKLVKLEALAEKLLEESGGDSPALDAVYDRQSELDPSTFESRASLILVGLGFDAVRAREAAAARR